MKSNKNIPSVQWTKVDNRPPDGAGPLGVFLVRMIIFMIIFAIAYGLPQYLAPIISRLAGCDVGYVASWDALNRGIFLGKILLWGLVAVVSVVLFVGGVYLFFKHPELFEEKVQNKSPRSWMIAGALLGAATAQGGSKRAARGALAGWVGHKLFHSGKNGLVFAAILVLPYVITVDVGDRLFCLKQEKKMLMNNVPESVVLTQPLRPVNEFDSEENMTHLTGPAANVVHKDCPLMKGDDFGEEDALCQMRQSAPAEGPLQAAAIQQSDASLSANVTESDLQSPDMSVKQDFTDTRL